MRFSVNDETIRFIEHAFNAIHGLGCTAEFCDAAYELTHIDDDVECGVLYEAKWVEVPEVPEQFRAEPGEIVGSFLVADGELWLANDQRYCGHAENPPRTILARLDEPVEDHRGERQSAPETRDETTAKPQHLTEHMALRDIKNLDQLGLDLHLLLLCSPDTTVEDYLDAYETQAGESRETSYVSRLLSANSPDNRQNEQEPG